MTNKKKPDLDEYLAEQAKYPDSPFSRFFASFSLAFILKNLKEEKREKFLGLLENQQFAQIPEFLGKNIPDFAKQLRKATQNEIAKIKRISHLRGGRLENSNPKLSASKEAAWITDSDLQEADKRREASSSDGELTETKPINESRKTKAIHEL